MVVARDTITQYRKAAVLELGLAVLPGRQEWLAALQNRMNCPSLRTAESFDDIRCEESSTAHVWRPVITFGEGPDT